MTVSLVIDTATSRTIVGIVRDGDVIWQRFHDGATDHGNAVADLVKQALTAGVNPDRVVVGMGPGPFTGLRVGIAFARAFAAARSLSVIGICSLDAIVIDHDENFPADVQGYVLDLFPDIARLVELSADQNYTEPFYLRRPDAVATADRT